MTGTASERQRLLEEFFGVCNDSELSWVLQRGTATLFTPGKDVDLLVAPAHRPLFEEIVRAFHGVIQPGRVHTGHRTYLVGRPLRHAVPLDVVTGVTFSRRLQIASPLAAGCLERRVRDGWVYRLAPTDLFWTVLLHCLLDKRYFTDRRIADLTGALPGLARGGEAERFTAGLLPAAWSTDRVVACVEAGDFEALTGLAAEMSDAPPASPLRRNPRWGLDAVAARAYDRLWLAAGLGTAVRVDAVLDAAEVTSLVTRVRHRPRLVEVVVAVPDDAAALAEAALAAAGYRSLGGHWSRLRQSGLETVRVEHGSWFPEAGRGPATVPLGGRRHCRWAVAAGEREPGPAAEAGEEPR